METDLKIALKIAKGKLVSLYREEVILSPKHSQTSVQQSLTMERPPPAAIENFCIPYFGRPLVSLYREEVILSPKHSQTSVEQSLTLESPPSAAISQSTHQIPSLPLPRSRGFQILTRTPVYGPPSGQPSVPPTTTAAQPTPNPRLFQPKMLASLIGPVLQQSASNSPWVGRDSSVEMASSKASTIASANPRHKRRKQRNVNFHKQKPRKKKTQHRSAVASESTEKKK
ncbi:hypothetical protein CDAR_494521 [Caerostris darwini]|uniref:Uncharacterized protein n=1 Tax=Caerostris darwini TaxID=1538125 RepID=A0AAV4SB82_9ARAC|nr:hypothetical protein CDAR_494521 [Caerostris darwini]